VAQRAPEKIVKRKAPVQASGGAGFRYENAVAARFLIDLLNGTNSLGLDFGHVRRVDWQARDSGWLADDLVVTCICSGEDRAAGISIKSAQQVTRGGFPSDFVAVAWAQWLGFKTDRKFRGSNDAIVLLTGNLTHEVEDAWSNLLTETLRTAPERIAARLEAPADDGSQSSAIQRILFDSFLCPEELRSPGTTDRNATVQLMCRVRLLYLDYEAVPSRAHGLALADCQSALRSADAAEAESLWHRLNGIADEKRASGGSIDLPHLLADLRGEFHLRGHPDYRRDWEILERLSRDLMGDIRTEISGLTPLARTDERAKVQTRLEERRACFVVGESGCGKSALAKMIGQASYRRCVWIAESTVDHDSAAQFERGIGIGHPLSEVLANLSDPCLVVFDGIERYSPQAIRLTCRFVRDLLANADSQHIHVLVTAQFEAARQLIRRFVEFGLPPALHEAMPVGRPSEIDIQNLVAPIPSLQWASLRPELRPLLTNLKVLDWVVAAAQSGTAINGQSFVGLTNLIDALWERWIDCEADSLARSRVLKHLGILEGGTLSTGVPLMELDHSEQATLGALGASDLVRIREERVRFAHDLLGDWARMRVLVGEQSINSLENRERAHLPRWHRAVRLFGQRLLEQSADGAEQWQRAIDSLDDGTPTSPLIRDLFLESLFLATNAFALLERGWSALSANGGRLLNRMLDRFLFAATLPDPRITALTGSEAEAAEVEHLFRVPYWPYWRPMLMVLHARRAEVVRLAPLNAAKVCSLWLRVMPIELSPGQPMPWRHEAAELAVAIGREIQAQSAEFNATEQDKVAYEAVLWAAPELPDEVAELCLELAQRRDLHPEIRNRVDQAYERRREERQRWLAEHPEREQVPSPTWIHGDLRDPWPHGPRERVDTAFQEACLDTGAFAALARLRPDAAQEILLAVCIEEPQHDEYSRRSRRETGLDHWHNGDPPLYSRGPFLSFLRNAPDQGLSFVLILVNFSTRRFAQDESLAFTMGDESRTWFGTSHVFRWHYDWPLFNGAAIHCSLMALERWLYELIDNGTDVEPFIKRIVNESESLAFAGLLFDVGKRLPSLFAGALKPLLCNWMFVDWDIQVTTLRCVETGVGPSWGSQPAALTELAREWFAMPHRRNLLAYLNGGVVTNLVSDEQHWPFLQGLRVGPASWMPKASPRGSAS
jgi:hypothetical protein